jgi:NAD(P)-dependent dehydrogenase (short-subunit alcohol dehydrogenase family)
VGDVVQIEEMFNKISNHFEGIDILVSNAYSGSLSPAMEINPRQWTRTMDNARGLLTCSQLAHPLMLRRGGEDCCYE